MIKTKEFTMTQQEYFRITLTGYFRQRWWAWTPLSLGTIYCLTIFPPEQWPIFLAIFIGTFVYYVLIYWRFAHSDENRAYFQPYHINFAQEHIEIYRSDDFSRIGFDSLGKIKRRSQYMQLYVAKTQFIYVPYSAFESQHDLERLNTLLQKYGY